MLKMKFNNEILPCKKVKIEDGSKEVEFEIPGSNVKIRVIVRLTKAFQALQQDECGSDIIAVSIDTTVITEPVDGVD